MRKAIRHTVSRISDHEHGYPALQLMMTCTVKSVADRECTYDATTEKNDLARCAAFTKAFGKRIHLVPAMTEILMGDNEICSG